MEFVRTIGKPARGADPLNKDGTPVLDYRGRPVWADKAGKALPWYEVVDRAPDKGSPEWTRVAAVFVMGVKWQFKARAAMSRAGGRGGGNGPRAGGDSPHLSPRRRTLWHPPRRRSTYIHAL